MKDHGPSHQFVWVDIPVIDLDRAIAFYTAVLGQAVQKQEMPGFAMGILPHDDSSVGGCLAVMEGVQPSQNGPLLYFNAEGRLEEAAAAVEPAGGKVLQPVHPIGPYGKRAVVLDSEGNRIALHSH